MLGSAGPAKGFPAAAALTASRRGATAKTADPSWVSCYLYPLPLRSPILHTEHAIWCGMQISRWSELPGGAPAHDLARHQSAGFLQFQPEGRAGHAILSLFPNHK